MDGPGVEPIDSEPPTTGGRDSRRRARLVARVRALVKAIQTNDEAKIERAVVHLSQSRKVFAPLVFAVGAFVLLFNALRLIVSNWRLALVQVLPAMWIWIAMLDLKAHVLHGRSLNVVRGPILIPLGLVVVALTIGSFFLNAVFAFAIAGPEAPKVRPGVEEAKRHWRVIGASGAVTGTLLAFSTLVVTRWGHPWFVLSLGIVIGLMMLEYITIPARLIGVKPTHSRRDKLWTSVVSGVLGATICTPPYLLGRLGILMLGSKVLRIPGVLFLAVGFTLQAGATGAVRAIKMTTSLGAARRAEVSDA